MFRSPGVGNSDTRLYTYGVLAVYRLKTLNPPAVLHVKVAYLRVPCGKSLMWVADPKNATEYGEREEAEKVARVLQLAKGNYEIEECKGTSKPPRAKKPTESLFD